MDIEKIITHYTDYVLKHNKRPSSVYKFSVDLKFEEEQFYAHFSSFDQVESEIFSRIVKNAVTLTKEDNEDTESIGGPKNLLLTFYLTLAEILKVNRSLILFILPQGKVELRNLRTIQAARTNFLDYIQGLNLSPSMMSFIPDATIKEKAINTGAWLQFISILNYWLKDNSRGFEKTDIFIEKSLKLSFELSDSNVLNSMVDLGKFMMNKR